MASIASFDNASVMKINSLEVKRFTREANDVLKCAYASNNKINYSLKNVKILEILDYIEDIHLLIQEVKKTQHVIYLVFVHIC